MKKHCTIFALVFFLGMAVPYAQKPQSIAHKTADKTAPPLDTTIVGSIKDLIPPTITCLNDLSVNIMPTGLISLWASDFLLSVEDNVTPVGQIKIGIRKAGTGIDFPLDNQGLPQINVLYNCMEQGAQTVELWAMDQAENVSLCETSVIIQDNALNCGGNGGQGELCTKRYCSQESIEEVIMSISGSVPFVPPFSFFDLSNAQGCFNFPQTIPLSDSFIVSPMKDANPLEGVTQYDLQLLSKHIHGIQLFTEPWQWVAADANRDNVVNIQDSIELANLISGTFMELPSNQSWRFVRSDYVFPSPNPLSQPFPESVSTEEWQMAGDILFLGIKIGDLSCLEPKPVVSEVVPDRQGNALGSESYNQHFTATLSPNPTLDKVTLFLDVPFPETAQFEIHDLSGRLIFQSKTRALSGAQSIEIPAIAFPGPGQYLWRVQLGSRVISGKVVRL